MLPFLPRRYPRYVPAADQQKGQQGGEQAYGEQQSGGGRMRPGRMLRHGGPGIFRHRREEQPSQPSGGGTTAKTREQQVQLGGAKVGIVGHGRIQPGCAMPHIVLNTVQGGRMELGAPTGQYQMIVVYRGKHCPVSRNYLASLEQIMVEMQDLGVDVVAVTCDGRERAESFADSWKSLTNTNNVSFKIAYGLPIRVAEDWGLYISEPRSSREAEGPFPEPALFLVDPDGMLTVVDISNSPFARPDLRILVEGIRYIQENDYPVRGTLASGPAQCSRHL